MQAAHKEDEDGEESLEEEPVVKLRRRATHAEWTSSWPQPVKSRRWVENQTPEVKEVEFTKRGRRLLLRARPRLSRSLALELGEARAGAVFAAASLGVAELESALRQLEAERAQREQQPQEQLTQSLCDIVESV